MAFWWARRRRNWYGRNYRRKRYTRRQTRRRRKYYPRRWRRRRAPRRRRRRRGKVRKKRKTITVKQWQPDRIVNCRIKGFGELVLGAQGVQFQCYTNEKYQIPLPQCPGGGGFGVERYTLQYLYTQHIFRNNIWTKSNYWTDLCRYIKATFYLYRHPTLDFVVQYSRQPPFNIDKTTYPSFHPLLILLSQHHKVLPSLRRKPHGKPYKKITIKPPKQMLTKWFFQKEFCEYDLVQIGASVCSLDYPRISSTAENRVVTIYYLHPGFFQNSTWAHAQQAAYEPITNLLSQNLKFYTKGSSQPFTPNYNQHQTTTQGAYYASIQHDEGWFSTKILQAIKVTTAKGEERLPLPLAAARYNPAEDNGKGNEIWLASITGDTYHKPSDPILIFDNTPLWLAFWGYTNFIQKVKDKSLFGLSMFVIKSPFIKPGPTAQTQNYFPFVDLNFTLGRNPNNSYLTYADKKLWYPTVYRQLETINQIVECGPYVPKLGQTRESTWELPYKYNFFFKWGGPLLNDQEVADPKSKDKYPTPDTMQEAIQISNPKHQDTNTIFHEWDYRRGFITNKAIQRMSENLIIDSDVSSDAESSQKKRKRVTTELRNPEEKIKKIKRCLLSLCEESSCQETEAQETDLLKLIQQQKQQQQRLKHNLLILLKDMKAKQKMLQLQTGVLE
nr:MAG: ORF1 [Torque teno midi virus]